MRLLYRQLCADDELWRSIQAGGAALCLRHALPQGRVVALDPFVQLLRQRLRLWQWAIAEHQRKGDWQSRHEPPGREARDWLNACAALDGGAFGGGPPDAERLACIVPCMASDATALSLARNGHDGGCGDRGRE